jgi:holo-[acyl-carrier protein] synthase
MINGIGTDIVNIGRIDRLVKLYKEKFINRILSKDEIKYLSEIAKSNKIKYIAKRFAGKEAFAKALGLGIGRPINFRDIEITNDKLGKPMINLLNNSDLLKNCLVNISLSDDSLYAIAFVVISQFNK